MSSLVKDGQNNGASPQPAPEGVIQQLQKMLVSPLLRESHQLQTFLEFIVRETIEGRSKYIKEYVLGCRVFGRKPEYDPRRDGIVRVQATVLRKRLEKYYEQEGANDPIIIDLPRGGYVPSFRVRHAEIHQLQPSLPKPAVKAARRGLILAFLAGVVLTASIATVARPKVVEPFRITAATGAEFPQLWGPFLQRGANNIIAYGTPLFFAAEGLYIRDVDVNIPEHQDRRRVDTIAKALQISPQPQDDIYTGVGEIEATYRISNFFATNGLRVQVANARALGRSDLTGRNVVVISSLRFQTLLRDLELPSDFEFVPSWPEVIRNLHPKPGENLQYVYDLGAGISTSYALVSVWPGITPGTRIMCISGIHTWSTQSAADFLLQPEQLIGMARKFEKAPASPYFQILLRVEGRGNQPRRVDYLTHHYLSP